MRVTGLSAVCMLIALTAISSAAAQLAGMPDDGVCLRFTFGLKDTEPTDWGGKLTVSQGTVLRVDTGVPADSNTWKLRSRRPRQQAAVQPVELLVALTAPERAQVRVDTPQGTIAFAISDAPSGSKLALLDGAAEVERVPFFALVVSDPTEDDFPASATGADGSIWCAYVSYAHGPPIDMDAVRDGNFDSLTPTGHGDQVKLIGLQDSEWSAPVAITEPGQDVWRPAVTIDRSGDVWVVWAQNVDGNWDLFARGYLPGGGKLSTTRRLTTTPGADINPALVTAIDGDDSRTWVAWQGWREANFGIFLAELTINGIGEPMRVSTTDANDWHPTVAASSNGDVWVAWDTYAAGSYDVLVRQLSDGRLRRAFPVAASPRFEARPSIAVDAEDRVWIAYEDADANWGKDFGTRWPGEMGVPFYMERNILVRCLDGGKLRRPAAEFRSGLVDTTYDDKTWETQKHHRISMPRLAAARDGRVWLLFRRHPLASGGAERWAGFASYYDGDEWGPQVMLPRSHNLLDNRPGIAALPGGAIAVLYSTDGRITGPGAIRDNNIQSTVLSAEGDARPPTLVRADPRGSGSRSAPIHPAEAQDIARVGSYRVEVGGKTYRLLRGEFHRHTEISSHRDWDGPLEEVWRYGLDVARMNWIGVGDHDYGGGREYTWWLTQKQTDMYHHAPTFVPAHTYERSVPYPSGHRNVMFEQRGIRAVPRLGSQQAVLYGTPEEGSPDIKNLYRYLKAFGGICASHTSATNMGTDWRDNDPEVEPVVEIYQGHRQSYEEPGAPLAAKSAEESIQGYHADGFVWQALAKGNRIGFQASSDHVSTHLSYAVVLAEEVSRAGILNAFKQRHSYGAHDNIVLDVRSGEHVMGDEFAATGPPTLDIVALGTAPIARVDIVRQIEGAAPIYVYATEPGKQRVTMRWQDTDAEPGQTNMYYVRIMQVDAKLAWASPMWIRNGQ